jgi:DNA repair exonuclease SbcCD ATPase subunit
VTECGGLLDDFVVETGRAERALAEVGRLQEEFRALLDQSFQVEADQGQLELLIGEIGDEIEALREQQEQDRLERFAEIDELLAAITERLNEIQAMLDGGADLPPAPPDQVGALFAEAQRLGEERDELLGEQAVLVSGTGDPGGRQPTIDARTAELAETARLLEENRQERALVSEQMLANHDAQEQQSEVQRAARSAADDVRSVAAAAGCDWAVDDGGEDPVDPEDPEDPVDPEGPVDPEDPGGDSGGGSGR